MLVFVNCAIEQGNSRAAELERKTDLCRVASVKQECGIVKLRLSRHSVLCMSAMAIGGALGVELVHRRVALLHVISNQWATCILYLTFQQSSKFSPMTSTGLHCCAVSDSSGACSNEHAAVDHA